ncbi:NAD(P)-binding protein [Calocera viscosa TUFC12733]|uniref:NAD(P)-binding protein n=1 Tax=Calocera viscosa (strain TUFC12733) TaxID=1330018 RepID=A0A167K9F3_CALVF|nr:NAD(P)-binding protein [Calocera viscosa TUFC12733]
MAPTFLITGAGRGIGLSFVKALLTRDNTAFIFAGVRNIATATELQTIAKADNRVVMFPLDLDDEGSIQSAARVVASRTPSLSVLINNAGFAPEKTTPAASVPSGDFLQAFRTNTLGPILLTQALLPLLEKSGGLVVNVSSLLGSIQVNPGRQVAYAVSKAGLNMATTIFQKQNKDKNVTFVAAHPGTVATDMRPDLRQPGAMPHITAEESAQGILQNIVFSGNVAALGGRFITWDGKDMPW